MNRIHIRVTRHSAFYSPLWVTVAGDQLRTEGLEATYDVATPTRTVAGGIGDGTVQVAQSAVATHFGPLERGETVPYKHFAQINERDGFFLVSRRSDPEFHWKSMEGRTVLADHFFQPMAMLRFALACQNTDASAIRFVDAGEPDAMEQAFRNGMGDFVHLQGPAAQRLAHDEVGQVVVAVGEAIGPVAFSSLCASPTWLGSASARAFMRAYRRGRADAGQLPPSEVAARVGRFFPNVGAAILTETIRQYQALGCWNGGCEISRATFEKAREVFSFGRTPAIDAAYENVVVAPPDG